MKKTLMMMAVVLNACGPQSLVSDGTYKSDASDSLPNATLVINLKEKTASVTPAGASSVIVLQLTAIAAGNWEKGCPTNTSSVSVETWTLAPGPAVLGSLSLADPRLIAGCGLDKGDPDTVVIKGTGDPNATQYNLAFHREST